MAKTRTEIFKLNRNRTNANFGKDFPPSHPTNLQTFESEMAPRVEVWGNRVQR